MSVTGPQPAPNAVPEPAVSAAPTAQPEAATPEAAIARGTRPARLAVAAALTNEVPGAIDAAEARTIVSAALSALARATDKQGVYDALVKVFHAGQLLMLAGTRPLDMSNSLSGFYSAARRIVSGQTDPQTVATHPAAALPPGATAHVGNQPIHAVACAMANDWRGVVSAADADRILGAALEQIRAADQPEVVYRRLKWALQAAQLLVGDDVDASRRLENYPQLARPVVSARQIELTGTSKEIASLDAWRALTVDQRKDVITEEQYDYHPELTMHDERPLTELTDPAHRSFAETMRGAFANEIDTSYPSDEAYDMNIALVGPVTAHVEILTLPTDEIAGGRITLRQDGVLRPEGADGDFPRYFDTRAQALAAGCSESDIGWSSHADVDFDGSLLAHGDYMEWVGW